MVRIAIFSKSENKVIDTTYNIEETRYFENKNDYDFIPVPDELKEFPIKITKIYGVYVFAPDENILERMLPDFLKSIRSNRNQLIIKTDYLMLADVESNKDKVKEYRQYLRDFTNKITVEYLVNNNMNMTILTYEEYLNL